MVDHSNVIAVHSGNKVIPVKAGPNNSVAISDVRIPQSLTRTVTTSADMTTATDITDAPTVGERIVVTDIIVSTDTAMLFTVQEETTGTVFATVYLAANSTTSISPIGFLETETIDKTMQGLASVSGNVTVLAIYASLS